MMIVMKRFVLLIMLLRSATAFGQQQSGTKVEDKAVPYYIDLNSARADQIYTAQVDIMGIKYTDGYGRWSDLPIVIYNWKQEKVAGVSLEKTFGVNYYSLKLSDIYDGWEFGKVYRCELADESGKKYVLPIKPINPPEKKGPDIDLVVNPISLDCDAIAKNLVEFYGEIKGGKAPYKVDWFVLNDARTDFLYQPKEERILQAGTTAYIQVDRDLDYYVLLYVQDACGSIKKKMVHMTCEERKKKINTIFLEPMNDELIKSFLKGH